MGKYVRIQVLQNFVIGTTTKMTTLVEPLIKSIFTIQLPLKGALGSISRLSNSMYANNEHKFVHKR